MIPYILILGGVAAASWLLERAVKPLSKIVKIIAFFGFLVGIVLLLTAAGTWSPLPDVYTQYLLIATGLALTLRPIKDIPWAALIALLVGGVCAGYVLLYIPLPADVFGISSTWIYLILFLIPMLIVYTFFKFLEDLLRLFGMILASKPISSILGLTCILQGLLLLVGVSVFTLILG